MQHLEMVLTILWCCLVYRLIPEKILVLGSLLFRSFAIVDGTGAFAYTVAVTARV